MKALSAKRSDFTPKAMLWRECGASFSCRRVSMNHHLRIESSKNKRLNSSWGQRAKGIGKSGRIGQSCVCALRSPGVRDGDGASHPLASRELDHLSSHLLDLRDRSRRAQYSDRCVRAGFGYHRTRDFGGRSLRDFPSRYHPIHSSSARVLILRPIQ